MMRSLLMRCLFSAGIAISGLGLTASAAVPSEGGKSVAPGEFQVAQHGGQICCREGRHYYWTRHRRCERRGGSHVRDRYCRDGRGWDDRGRVCCKRGRHDWWTSSYRRCRRAGGHVVANRACRRGPDDRGRVCCKRGRHDWWTSSYRRCRRAGGHVVANRACRRGWDDRDRHEVCCYRRSRGFRQFRVMGVGRCDRWGGRPVRWRYCRR